MRILLPYLKVSNYDLESKQITGGLERFSQLLYNNIPNVIPVYFNKDDKINTKLLRQRQDSIMLILFLVTMNNHLEQHLFKKNFQRFQFLIFLIYLEPDLEF